MSNKRLKKVFQLGIVVADAKSAAENFCQLFDLPLTSIQYADTHQSHIPMKYKGRSTTSYNLIAIVPTEGIEFEFIQFVDGVTNSQKEYFDQCGAGIQHIGIATDDYTATINRMQQIGAETLIEGSNETMGYCYMDLRSQMGLIFELYSDQLTKIKGL